MVCQRLVTFLFNVFFAFLVYFLICFELSVPVHLETHLRNNQILCQVGCKTTHSPWRLLKQHFYCSGFLVIWNISS